MHFLPHFAVSVISGKDRVGSYHARDDRDGFPVAIHASFRRANAALKAAATVP
jgi:hypothetical protein